MERQGTEFVSFEQATRCPRCDQPGEVEENTARRGPNRSKIFMVWCRNGACKWNDTNWVVQQLEDGTVPVRAARADQPRRLKTFPKLPGTRDSYMGEVERADDTRNLGPEGPRSRG